MTTNTPWTAQNVTVHQIAKTIDHSLLRPELTTREVLAGCGVAAQYDRTGATATAAIIDDLRTRQHLP